MLILIQILTIVYYLSINVYSFLLLRSQKKAEEDGDCNKVRDGNLFITAILGGALGIYLATFILRFRTKSLFIMVFMCCPTVNRSAGWLIRETEMQSMDKRDTIPHPISTKAPKCSK